MTPTWAFPSDSQYGTLEFFFLTSKFYLFPSPPIKLKLGLQIGERLLIATQLGPLKPSSQLEIESSSLIQFLFLYQSSNGGL